MLSKLLITICCPDRNQADLWGDYHFAHALGESLKKYSFAPHISFLYEWKNEPDSYDLHIHLRGQQRFNAGRKARKTVLWHISHPETVSTDEYASYDVVGVASPLLAKRMKRLVDVPVITLLQATAFTTDKLGKELENQDVTESPLIFVGNTRSLYRQSVRLALLHGLQPRIYGSGWDNFVDPSIIVRHSMPNRELPDLYRSARLVLNDHHDTMREQGFISNRIYDVLAAGGLPYTDYVPGLIELFEDAVPYFTGHYDFIYGLREANDQPHKRAARILRGNQIVLSHHTFAHRAQELVNVL